MVEHDPIDREIDALLDAEPSPDFVARVRARVEGESIAPRTWLTGRWLVVAAATAAAVIIVSAALWFDRSSHPLVVGQTPPQSITTRVVESPSIRAEISPGSPATPPPPQVLVSPAEGALLQRLLVAARDARVEPSPNLPDDAPLNPPLPIVIEPIHVEPLLAAELEPGAQQ